MTKNDNLHTVSTNQCMLCQKTGMLNHQKLPERWQNALTFAGCMCGVLRYDSVTVIILRLTF
jgi:hypothetical protein